MKLVTVLVPRHAPTTVAAASETKACWARGSLLSFMKPGLLGHANQGANRVEKHHEQKNENKGPACAGERAPARSILNSVGASEGGAETSPEASSNRVMSWEWATPGAWASEVATCGRNSFRTMASEVGPDDAEEDRAAHPAGMQRRCQEQSEKENQQIRRGQVAG